jgi:hypothetical protein
MLDIAGSTAIPAPAVCQQRRDDDPLTAPGFGRKIPFSYLKSRMPARAYAVCLRSLLHPVHMLRVIEGAGREGYEYARHINSREIDLYPIKFQHTPINNKGMDQISHANNRLIAQPTLSGCVNLTHPSINRYIYLHM